MIFAFVLLACKKEAPSGGDPGEEPALVPEAGEWMISWLPEFDGDCALADMATYEPQEVIWAIELESNGFTLYDETGYPLGCDLQADGAFFCSLGTYSVEYDGLGTEVITTTFEGVFTATDALEAGRNIHAECYGEDCAALGTGYGPSFTYPCTAIAPLTGALLED